MILKKESKGTWDAENGLDRLGPGTPPWGDRLQGPGVHPTDPAQKAIW